MAGGPGSQLDSRVAESPVWYIHKEDPCAFYHNGVGYVHNSNGWGLKYVIFFHGGRLSSSTCSKRFLSLSLNNRRIQNGLYALPGRGLWV